MFMLSRMHAMNALAEGGVLPLEFVAGDAQYNAAVNKPTGTQAGDIMFAFIASSATSATISAEPSGWTLLASNTSSQEPFVYYKVAGGSEPSTYDWTVSGNRVQCVVTYRSGALGTTGTMSTNATAGSITPATTGTLLAMFAATFGNTIATPPSGMTQRAYASGAGCSAAIFDQENVGASATPAKTIVWSTGGNSRSIQQHVQQA